MWKNHPFSKLISCIYLTLFCSYVAFTQSNTKVLFSTDDITLIAGIPNHISIVARQETPISLDQITVSLYTSNQYVLSLPPYPVSITKANDKFVIRPDSVGWINIKIKLKDEIISKEFPVHPIPAVCYIGSNSANSYGKVWSGNLKQQKGMIARIECCGFDAHCKVDYFEVIRINKRNRTFRASNNGSKFEKATLKLIKAARSGDLFIFRNIEYHCPGGTLQRSQDMIFEIE